MTVKEVFLIRDESRLTITPALPELEALLTYEKKVMEQDPEKPWIRKTKKLKKPAFRIKEGTENEPKVMMTFQGFWKKVQTFLESRGYKVTIKDMRLPFPAPKLQYMSGFRFSQQGLLTTCLNQNDSGLLGAPTRYGKTTLMINTIRAYPVMTVVTAPGEDLIRQLYEDIKEKCPHRHVVLIGAGSKVRYPSDDITVCSMDSLSKCDVDRTRLLLIDEPHAAVTDSRLPMINSFHKARRIGFGATLKGRYDNRDVLIEGLIGPVLAERTYLEAVAEGAICPLVVLMLNVKISKGDYKSTWKRDKAYKNLIYESPRIASITRKICHEIIPAKWQTLFFIKNEAQADHYIEYIGHEGTIAMAKKMNKAERLETMERMKSGEILRCLASDIYSQGVTFPDVRALVNIGGGGANTTTIQKPGRLAEVRPNKKCGVVFDFFFVADDDINPFSMGESRMILYDSVSRRKAYLEKGYKVVDVSTFSELKKAFETECL